MPDNNADLRSNSNNRSSRRAAYTQAAATIVAARITAAAMRSDGKASVDVAEEFVLAFSAIREGMKTLSAQRKAQQGAMRSDADEG